MSLETESLRRDIWRLEQRFTEIQQRVELLSMQLRAARLGIVAQSDPAEAKQMGSDEDRGFYRRYNVTRTDGSSEAGGRHEHCSYYVLDIDHDPFAVPALKAYAEACRKSHPTLAADIDRIVVAAPAGNMARRLMFHAEEP